MELFSRREALKITAANFAFAGPSGAAAIQGGPPSRTFDVVFEGGGIKGAAMAGALEEFEKAGFGYRRLIGTSAGAIVATLIAAGIRPGRLLELLVARGADGRHLFATFLEPPKEIPVPAPDPGEVPKTVTERAKRTAFEVAWRLACQGLMAGCGVFKLLGEKHPKYTPERMKGHVGRGLSVLSTGAAADDRAFLDWLGDRLKEAGFGDVDVTLADFHARSAGKGIQLSLVATDVTAKRSLVLNHKTAPGVPVRWAVRMSMGIPLVWAEVEWREQWGQYHGSSMFDEQGGHRVVDGGVLSNFPLKYLLEEKHARGDGVLGPFREDVRASKLGLLLDETLPVPGSEIRAEKRRFAEKVAAYQSLSRLVDTMLGAWDQDILDDPKVKPIVCRIPVKGYDTLEFDMDPARMEPLVESGRDAFEKFMKVPK